MRIKKWLSFSPDSLSLNGETISVVGSGVEMLHELYRRKVGDYPKFFKMDMLGKLGFVASELLLQSLSYKASTDIWLDSRVMISFLFRLRRSQESLNMLILRAIS